jgi:hypothetical protein
MAQTPRKRSAKGKCGRRELGRRKNHETHRFQLAGPRPTRHFGFRSRRCRLRSWRISCWVRLSSWRGRAPSRRLWRRCGRAALRRGCREARRRRSREACLWRAPPCRLLTATRRRARLPLTAGFWQSVKSRSVSLGVAVNVRGLPVLERAISTGFLPGASERSARTCQGADKGLPSVPAQRLMAGVRRRCSREGLTKALARGAGASANTSRPMPPN